MILIIKLKKDIFNIFFNIYHVIKFKKIKIYSHKNIKLIDIKIFIRNRLKLMDWNQFVDYKKNNILILILMPNSVNLCLLEYIWIIFTYLKILMAWSSNNLVSYVNCLIKNLISTF